MRYRKILVLMLISLGCTRDRGRFAVLSPDAVGPFEKTSTEVVIGKACFESSGDDPVFRKALDEALRKAPGADALIGAKLTDEGKCVYVSGIPAKLNSTK